MAKKKAETPPAPAPETPSLEALLDKVNRLNKELKLGHTTNFNDYEYVLLEPSTAKEVQHLLEALATVIGNNQHTET